MLNIALGLRGSRGPTLLPPRQVARGTFKRFCLSVPCQCQPLSRPKTQAKAERFFQSSQTSSSVRPTPCSSALDHSFFIHPLERNARETQRQPPLKTTRLMLNLRPAPLRASWIVRVRNPVMSSCASDSTDKIRAENQKNSHKVDQKRLSNYRYKLGKFSSVSGPETGSRKRSTRDRTEPSA